MKLLIDAGNSRLKWATWDGVGLSAIGVAENVERDLAALWAEDVAPDAVWIASVAGAPANAALAGAVRQRWGLEPGFAMTRAQVCGLRVAYARPQDLGVDRFLGMLAVHVRAHAAAVVASCGTALTLDAIDASGTHLGGLIAASPGLAAAALRGATARLGAAAVGSVTEFADNTADALQSGTWLAAVALVERFHANVAAKLALQPKLVLSGGGATSLSSLLTVPHQLDPGLVLRGLAIFADNGG